MSGNRSGERPARSPRLLVAITEKYLRKRHVLAADDHLIEFKVGKVQHWAVAGSQQPLPPAYVRLDIRQLRGMSSCSYSAHRLFLVLGTEGIRLANLEFVWHADCRGRTLRLVFSSPQLTVLRWEPDAGENEAKLAGFAARIMDQRDHALAALPPESRHRAADHLALLDRSGLLAAALAEQEAPPDPSDSTYVAAPALPRTYVGRWLRATMLDQRDLRDQLVATLNGGVNGWNDDEPLVLQIAGELLACGYFGPVPDEDEITRLADVIHQALGPEKHPVDERSAQAIIKSALGSTDAGDVAPAERFVVLSVLVGLLSQLLNLQEATVDTLVGDAEREAFELGAHPPVAPHTRLPT